MFFLQRLVILEFSSVSEPCLKSDTYIDPVEAAAKIIDEYENFIRWAIRSQNKDNISDDDLFQEFYLELISTPVPPNITNIKSYLYKAVVNHLTDFYRQKTAYEKNIKNFEKKIDFKVNKNDPAYALLIKEEMNKMFEYIKTVSPGQKYVAITLRYRDGYTIQEVADKMGIKYTSAVRYISKGIGKIRQCLKNT